ncbi:hypothetical protein R5R35_005081 [Gryllus longicercus]|uniref:Uncharacterized protein n=1 Tax=Gryllus longicercus TaxID=2509291 RepID=A0AAN9VL17_9ORTH
MPRTSRPERRAFVLISPPATRVRQLAACACPLSWLAVRRHRTGALLARSRRRQRPPPRYVSPEGAPPPLLGACKLQPAPALLHQASRNFGRHAAKRPPTTSRQQAPSCALDFLENFVAHDTPAAQPRSPRGAATGKNFSLRLVSLLNRRPPRRSTACLSALISPPC